MVSTWEDGGAYHPEYLSQVFMRLMKKLDVPPTQQRTLWSGLGQPLVLLREGQLVLRGKGPPLQPVRAWTALLLAHGPIIGRTGLKVGTAQCRDRKILFSPC
ncbi:hypothetical protein ACWCQW_48795 [Streptomyces mirabilis]